MTVNCRASRNRRRNTRRNAHTREKRALALQEKITLVKNSNLTYNLSSADVPDSAYLALSLGSSFVPSGPGSKHEDVFATKLFNRKFRWAVFFKEREFNNNIVNIDEAVIENRDQNYIAVARIDLLGAGILCKLAVPERLKPNYNENPIIQIS